MSKISNSVYCLLNDTEGPFKIKFTKNDELHIVEDVVYFNGYPLPFEMQSTIYNWMQNTPSLFKDVTRRF